MLKVSLPIIPFYTLPKKKWEVDQERKERIEFDSDSSTEEEDPPTNSQEKKKSHRLTLNHNDSFDSLDELDSIGGKMDDVEKDVRESVKSIEDANFGFSTKGPVTATKMVHYNINAIGTGKDSPRPGGEHIEVPLKLAEMYEDPSSEKPIHFFKVGPFYYVWRHLKAWKERVKKRRMHYMIKHYYLKIMKHNEAIKAKREEEMMKKEYRLQLEGYRADKRLKDAKFKVKRVNQNNDYLTEAIKRRDAENTRMEFNCYHFQAWAAENYHRHVRENEEKAQQEERERLEKEQLEKEQILRETIEADAQVLVRDVEYSQVLVRQMRQTGILPGVNVASKGQAVEPTSNNTKKYIELRIRPTVDFTDPISRKMRSKEYVSPFDVDLNGCRHVTVLRCYDIGELGAIALGGEIIRGVCNRITTLDLTMCGIQSRGLNKLLYGIRVGGVSTLETLKLKHNHLTPRCLGYLKECFKAGIFENLKILDLGCNEIGDEGVREISHMICHADKYFYNIEQINLQENMITDVGFAKLMKIIVHVQKSCMPNINYLCLRNNQISGQIRVQYMPLPLYVSL